MHNNLPKFRTLRFIVGFKKDEFQNRFRTSRTLFNINGLSRINRRGQRWREVANIGGGGGAMGGGVAIF
jgi:hypothetical protein